MKQKFKNIAVVMMGALVSGCSFFDAPPVPNERPGGGSISVNQAIEGGCQTRLGGQVAQVVTVPLKEKHDKDVWVYWTAGSDSVQEQPDSAWVESANWDLRVKRKIPVIGTNGGITSRKIAKLAEGQARAALLFWSTRLRDPLPEPEILENRADWSEDRYEGIEFDTLSLIPDYQNPLINRVHLSNTAETGILSAYDPGSHDLTLSGNVFILRAANGRDFFALRFCEYSRPGNWIQFQWVRLAHTWNNERGEGMNLKNWSQVAGVALGLGLASVVVAEEVIENGSPDVVQTEVVAEATPTPEASPTPTVAPEVEPVATAAPEAEPSPTPVVEASPTPAPAVLKECTFDVAFAPVPPKPEETRVLWNGLNLFNCSVVRATRETNEVKSESGELTKLPGGVFPGVLEGTEEQEELKWQVRVRQAYVGTNAAVAGFVKDAKFETLDVVAEKQTWAADRLFDADGKYGPGGVDYYNPTVMGWARFYDPERHAFMPVGQVYVVKTPSGHFAKLQVVKYIVNGGGYEADPEQEGGFVWNPDQGPKDGRIHMVLRSVANLTKDDTRLK
ncbi:MAG TPA: hypothetical protein PLH57_03420 [Oligoflexia bacterium]|nr:hypothetical protein [Oligoflexia bacterium]